MNLSSSDAAILVNYRVTIKEGKYLDLAWELKIIRNMRETVIPVMIDALGRVYRGWEKLEDIELYHPNYSMFKIGQNSQKSPVT